MNPMWLVILCYCLISGKKWIKSMILTASLFPFICFGIGFLLNTVAIFYGSLAAIPFGTMVVVFVIWAFVSFPLALLGTVVGRNWSGAPNNPCRVKTIPRPIPEKKWYLTPSIISLMGGLLPFGSIFIEMYFVFTSFWNYKVTSFSIHWFVLLIHYTSGWSVSLKRFCINLNSAYSFSSNSIIETNWIFRSLLWTFTLVFVDYRFTMSMGLCYLCLWYWSLSRYVWQLWGHISCWMPRTITGNGLHSSLLLQLLSMFTSTPYITIMWRLRCSASSKQVFILGTPWCSVLAWAYYVVSLLFALSSS